MDIKQLPPLPTWRGRAYWWSQWYLSPLPRWVRRRISPRVGHPPVYNYRGGFEGDYTRRGLLVTHTYPFHQPETAMRHITHVGTIQAIETAHALNRLGIALDIVDQASDTFDSQDRYDVLFANGNIFRQFSAHKKIYVTVGAAYHAGVANEARRIARVQQTRGVRLPSVRYAGAADDADLIAQADAHIAMGNAAVASHFRPKSIPRYTLDNFAFPTDLPDLGRKSFEQARHHFLWFGGTGLLHKGLDLLLELFAKLPHLHLWICGALHTPIERPFVQAYRHELFDYPNIHAVGYVRVGSAEFNILTDRCAFTILPSCAEGMAGSILDCMRRGLIPLVTAQTGIDTDQCGVTFQDDALGTIRAAVERAAQWSAETLQAEAQTALDLATARYTREKFGKRIEETVGLIG